MPCASKGWAILGEGFADLFDRLDVWRRERNEVSYAAVTPSAADVAAIQIDARDVLAAAERHVSEQDSSRR